MLLNANFEGYNYSQGDTDWVQHNEERHMDGNSNCIVILKTS